MLNIFKAIGLLQEFEPLIDALFKTPEGQALEVEVIRYFNKNPVSAPVSTAIEQAVLPQINVPSNTPLN
jgi:hypothetical protein